MRNLQYALSQTMGFQEGNEFANQFSNNDFTSILDSQQ